MNFRRLLCFVGIHRWFYGYWHCAGAYRIKTCARCGAQDVVEEI